jgi:hypothetical protein
VFLFFAVSLLQNITFVVQILTTAEPDPERPGLMRAKPNPWFIICTTFTDRTGCNYFNLLHQVVAVTEEIGLTVRVIVCDCSGAHMTLRSQFPIVCMLDPVHVLLNVRTHFLKNLIAVGDTNLEHVSRINLRLGLANSTYWKMDFFLNGSSSSEPQYNSLFPPSYISDLFFLRGDVVFLNAYAINLNEINVIIEFVQKLELTFQRMFNSDLYDEIAKTRDEELQTYFDEITILSDYFLPLPTQIALQETMFATPIRLFEQCNFAMTDLNQWHLENVFNQIKKINLGNQPTKKQFMIFLNQVNGMDKTVIDNSITRFHRTLKEYLPVPNNVGNGRNFRAFDMERLVVDEDFRINMTNVMVAISKNLNLFDLSCWCINDIFVFNRNDAELPGDLQDLHSIERVLNLYGKSVVTFCIDRINSAIIHPRTKYHFREGIWRMYVNHMERNNVIIQHANHLEMFVKVVIHVIMTKTYYELEFFGI